MGESREAKKNSHEKFIGRNYEISADNMHTTTRNTLFFFFLMLLRFLTICCLPMPMSMLLKLALDCGDIVGQYCVFFPAVDNFRFSFSLSCHRKKSKQHRVNPGGISIKRENVDGAKKGLKFHFLLKTTHKS